MLTVPRVSHGPKPPKREHEHSGKDQLHYDRIHALITLLVLIAMFALMFWLAAVNPTHEAIDYGEWMMP